MKKAIISTIIIFSFVVLSCNNASNTNEHTDSLGNQVGPANSPVRPNDNSNAMPNGNEGNSGGLDTARTDSLVGKDSLK